MANSISINPLATTNGLGSFSIQSDGYVQGVALDNPSIRNQLSMGILNSTETIAMVGGLPMYELLHASTNNGVLGGLVGRATASTGIQSWCVYNQGAAFITTPQSQAPSAGSGASIPLYRAGTGAQIAVPIDPTVAAGLLGGSINPTGLYWDVTNLVINTTSSGNIALTGIRIVDVQIGNSKTVSYDSVNNVFNWVATGSVAIVQV